MSSGERTPVDPSLSEATRLLCTGAYVHHAFRTKVIEQLYVHEERFAAPSYGIDAVRVLAHALRARRIELAWAVGMLALWVLATKLTEGMFLMLLAPCVLLALAPFVRGTGKQANGTRRALALLVRWYGRAVLAFLLLTFLSRGFAGGDPYEGETSGLDEVLGWFQLVIDLILPGGSDSGTFSALEPGLAWLTLGAFALNTAAVGAQRAQFARIMDRELSVRGFGDLRGDPAEEFAGSRFERLGKRIAVEQQSPLIMYGAAEPFRGAGLPFQTWELAVELKPREDTDQVPIDNRTILDRIRPLVEALRKPSAHDTPERSGAVRDRLRELVVDECVFLPVAGLGARSHAPYGDDHFRRHLASAVEEGGETRRHFLRIRVGGWNEEVVVTVFVRVHTQGGMLMLEIAPHVLLPVLPAFAEAGRQAHRFRRNTWFGKAAWALAHTPAVPFRSVAALAGGLVGTWQVLAGGHRGALPEGPEESVRELGSDTGVSLFQGMDATRYLKSIQDRVAGGVRAALYEAGWQTGEFEQKVINIGEGGVLIGSVSNSAVGIGKGARAATTNAGPLPGGPHTGGPAPAGSGRGGNSHARS
ncbi:hypothetical protein ACFYVL_12000 [Streptomyces sp. NPDC004111]|uniref:hypothetical protein n=1 Tax=Streptomyces sp. NPDC004111 TaxID=3364690 RepID=UPI00368DEA9D